MSERIAIVTTSFPSFEGDPSGHFVLAEVKKLVLQGHRVEVIAPGIAASLGTNPRVHRIADGGCFGWPGSLSRLRRRPRRLVGAWRFVRTAEQRLARLAVDRVIAHWIVPSGWPATRRVRAALEVVAHGSDVELLLRLPKPVRCRIVGDLLRRETKFRFVSAALMSRLAAATTPRLLERSYVEPCAIDLSNVPARDRARARLGIEPDEQLTVIVGRLVRGKKPERSITESLRLYGGRVVVVGDGPLLAPLGRAYPQVTFTGRLPRPQTLVWIAAADRLLSASEHEGSPTAIREARALGVPVTSAAAGDVSTWAELDPGITLLK